MGYRFLSSALTLAVLAALFVGVAPATAAPAGPALTAPSAILMDASDGRVLFAKDPDSKRAIASTTKVLTALVVLERAKLSDMVVASAAAEQIGSNDPLVTELELVHGERLTVEQLLYGLLLPSANDAAVALAEHVGGSLESFSRLMNERARRAGARASNFVNPHGFDHPDHFSTARDLAHITRAALEIEVFRRIVSTRSHELPGPSGPRIISSRNQLLGAYPGADGVKTGQTRASGRSLISSATRGQERRLAVVLASSDPIADSSALLEHGFTGFGRERLLTKGVTWGYLTRADGRSSEIKPRGSVSILVPKGEPAPQVRFMNRDRKLRIEVPGSKGIEVQAELSCLKPCSTTTTGSLGRLLIAVTSIVSLL